MASKRTKKKPVAKNARRAPRRRPSPPIDRRQTTSALGENGDEFQATFNMTSVGFCQAEPLTGCLLRVNRAFCDLVGYEEAELLNRPFAEITHPDDRAVNLEGYQRLIRGETAEYRVTMRYVRKDGRVIWADVTVNLVRDLDGRPWRTVALIQDITDRRQTEEALQQLNDTLEQQVAERTEALRQSDSHLTHLIEHFPGPISRVNRELRYLYASPGYEQWFGRDPKSIVGLTVPEVIGEAAFQWARPFTMRALAGEQVTFELSWPKPSGGTRTGLVTLDPEVESSGACVGFSVYVIDISARKQAEEALRQLSATLEQRVAERTAALTQLTGQLQAEIDERKKAQEMLRARSAELQITLDTAATGLVRNSRDLHYRWVNEAYAKLVRRPVEDIVGRQLSDVLGAEGLAKIRPYIDAVLRGERVEFAAELPITGRESCWLHVVYMPDRDAAGDVIGWVGSITDITERKRAETTLRDSEAQLRRILKQSFAGIVQTDTQGHMVLVNQRWCEMLGYSEAELLQMSVADITHPSSLETTLEAVGRLSQGGPDFQIEKNYRRKDGTILRAHSNVSALRDAEGNFQGLLAVVLDLTDRLEAETALRESEERFRGIFEHAAEGIAISDVRGNLVRCNAVFSALTGYSHQELAARHFSSLIHPDDRAQNLELVQELLEGKRSWFHIDNRYITKSGSPVWVQKQVSLVRNVKHQPLYFVALVTDISHRKRDEAVLRQQQAKLEDLTAQLLTAQDDERRRIARELHDDHVQRLAALALDLHQLARSPLKSVESAKAVITQFAQSVEGLTRELQQVTHQLHPSTLNHLGLEATLHDHVEEFARRTGLQTDVQVHEVPAQLPEVHALCLFRVLQECLQNVRKHAHASRVLVRLIGTGRGVGLCVHDDGRGFDAAQDESGGQRGLGLISLEERLQALNGTFRLRTKPGDGTEVHAWLPLEPEPVPAEGGGEQ